MFKLHKILLKTTHSVADLNLCTTRLMDNAKFPWLILIPKRKNIRQILDLNKKDQIKLMEEIDYCSRVMKKAFKAFNLNVEKITIKYLSHLRHSTIIKLINNFKEDILQEVIETI